MQQRRGVLRYFSLKRSTITNEPTRSDASYPSCSRPNYPTKTRRRDALISRDAVRGERGHRKCNRSWTYSTRVRAEMNRRRELVRLSTNITEVFVGRDTDSYVITIVFPGDRILPRHNAEPAERGTLFSIGYFKFASRMLIERKR